MPADQRCGDAGTNQLDIDSSAYVRFLFTSQKPNTDRIQMALTGQAFGSVWLIYLQCMELIVLMPHLGTNVEH